VDLANFAGQISIAPVFIAENKAELLMARFGRANSLWE
jgi:hypothetical protein